MPWQLQTSTVYYDLDKILSAGSVPAFDTVSTDASKAAAPRVAESKATPAPPAQTPFRAISTLKPRPWYQPKTAQDSLDFDKILVDSQLLPRPLTSSKKRNLPESERSLSDQRHRRSDDFIGHRIYMPQDEDWSQAELVLNESPFSTIRPTTERLLESHVREVTPIPRGFQVFQNLMRWNLGRRAGGVDLSFLREQDRAFSDLRAIMSGRAPRGSSSNATHATAVSGAALANSSGHSSNGAANVASATARPGSACKTKTLAAVVATVGTKRRSPSPCPRPTTPSVDNVKPTLSPSAAKKVCTGSPATSPGRNRIVQLSTSSLSPHRSDRSVESKAKGGSSSGDKPLQPKQEQPEQSAQPHEKVAVAPSTSGSVITTNSKKRSGSRRDVMVVIPKVVVTANDETRVDGETLQPGGPRYARFFGVAYDEKARDPEWRIANGMVDRCYYRGSKKEAKARPGDYFATDHAMLADFVRRRPEIFSDEEKEGRRGGGVDCTGGMGFA